MSGVNGNRSDCKGLCLLILCVLTALLVGFFILGNIDENQYYSYQESTVVRLSQSTIVRIERHGKYGLALTSNNNVYLMDEDVMCRIASDIIDVYMDDHHRYYLLTRDMSIISINNSYFGSVIDYFSIYESMISSIQSAYIFDKCKLMRIGEVMTINPIN